MALLKDSKPQNRLKKVTSIGCSKRSMPKNKHKRRSWKRYRGQGK